MNITVPTTRWTAQQAEELPFTLYNAAWSGLDTALEIAGLLEPDANYAPWDAAQRHLAQVIFEGIWKDQSHRSEVVDRLRNVAELISSVGLPTLLIHEILPGFASRKGVSRGPVVAALAQAELPW
jgi:hypothetical protein